MSKISLQGDPSGTGTFTVAAPNSNSNYTLTLPTETGTVLTNNGNQTGTFAALTVNGNNISADNSLGFRNRIINGDMRIDQRNAGAAVTINSEAYTYSVDRWSGYGAAADGVFTQQRSTTAPVGFTNSWLTTVTTADASIGSTQYYIAEQFIEGFNTADLGWGTANAKTITISFWVRSSLTGTFGGSVGNSAFDRSYPFSYSISSANTFEYKTITIAGDTSGTWLTDNGIGIRLYFDIGSGSSRKGTAGAWAATGYVGATGATNLISTLNATWYITGVQLEVGSTATPFERRDYGRELMMCQRYFQRLKNLAVTTRYLGVVQAYSTAQTYGVLARFPITFRTSPSVSISTSFGGFYNSASGGASTDQPSSLSTDGQSIETGTWGGASGLTAGQGLVFYWNSGSYIDGSAEL